MQNPKLQTNAKKPMLKFSKLFSLGMLYSASAIWDLLFAIWCWFGIPPEI
jgi:hypothetical protein